MMRKDFVVDDFITPPHPKEVTLLGDSVRLEPLGDLCIKALY